MAELAYFDSCVFILLQPEYKPDHFEACEHLRILPTKNELIIVTSILTSTEVNKLPETKALPEEQSRKILAFFENPYIAVRPPDRRTAEDAHELTRTHGLLPLDAIHVATAVVNKVPVLYTYDASKGRRRGLLSHHLRIGNPPLRIEKPPDKYEGTIFAQELRSTDETATEPKAEPAAEPAESAERHA